MKYLKTYENVSDIKKYFIMKIGNDYGIIEKIKILEENIFKRIKIKQLYAYTTKLVKYPLETQSFTFNISTIENKILYQSDNLQDCLDNIEIFSKSDTYNL